MIEFIYGAIFGTLLGITLTLIAIVCVEEKRK
jgi:uncharacterized membrane protein YoaK (UPF0700 family)